MVILGYLDISCEEKIDTDGGKNKPSLSTLPTCRKVTMETMGHVTKPISPLLHTNGIH